MKFHIIYINRHGIRVSENREFEDFNKAEDWLESIGATYWEIRIFDEV